MPRLKEQIAKILTLITHRHGEGRSNKTREVKTLYTFVISEREKKFSPSSPGSSNNKFKSSYFQTSSSAPRTRSTKPETDFKVSASPRNIAARITTKTTLNLSRAATPAAGPYLRARK